MLTFVHFRIAVCGCIGFVKQSHDIHAMFSCFHNKIGQIIGCQGIIFCSNECFFNEIKNIFVFVSQILRMLRVSCHSL